MGDKKKKKMIDKGIKKLYSSVFKKDSQRIIEEILELHEDLSKTIIMDVSYDTDEKFNIDLKIENDENYESGSDKREKLLSFLSKNKEYLSILMPYESVKSVAVFQRFKKKYDLIEKYEKELLIKGDKRKLPDLTLTSSTNISTQYILNNADIFKDKKKINNILIISKQEVQKIENIYDPEIDLLESHLLYLSDRVKYKNIDLLLVENGITYTKKKVSTSEFRKLYKNRKEKVTKIINEFNENSSKKKRKYKLHYSYINDPNEVISIKNNINKNDYIFSLIDIRLRLQSYIIDNKINNFSDNKMKIYEMLSQILIILSTQSINGDCIICIYYLKDMFMDQIINILNKYYKQVYLLNDNIKPFFTNFLFIICKNFKGISDSDFNKLLNLQKQLFEYDNTGGVITCNNDENITSLFKIKKYENKIGSYYKKNLKQTDYINNFAKRLKEIYEKMSSKEKISLHEIIINNHYKTGIQLGEILDIPINPILSHYFRQMRDNNLLFEIGLYNTKSIQKYRAKIEYDDTIEDMIKKRELDIEEGSLDKDQVDFFNDLIRKNKWMHRVGEIGFNVGISSDTFLRASPFINVTSFDIIIHEYVYDAKEFIDKKYPRRHLLIGGNSQYTVPYFHRKFPQVKFDLIFIDGDHSFFGAKQDIINMKLFSHKDTIMVFDDILPHKGSGAGPTKAWDWCKENKIIKNAKVIKFSHNKAVGVANYHNVFIS